MQRLSLALVLGLIACGGAGSFGLTADDNNPQLLAKAFGMVEAPMAGMPLNDMGKPVAYLVVRGIARKGQDKSAGKLMAFDLSAKKLLWTVDADVKSRVVCGRAFIAHLDGDGQMVGRDPVSGQRKWRHATGGQKFLGAAADGSRVYYVVQSSASTWTLTALDGADGDQLWSVPAPGQLGTPAARGGLVFSPFLKQWLVILNARTGDQITRIRGIDEEISFVRTTSDEVYFGSKTGIFLLDERAASGRKAESTYGSANLPTEFVRSFYHWDAFDQVQANYSAYDRNRVLWRARANDTKLSFDGGQVVVHTYRFFFGFDAATGALKWAYKNRGDAVSSDHLGVVVGYVSTYGEIGALDPVTGAKLYSEKVDLGGSQNTVRGATFDADGWKPGGTGQPADTAKALVSIARDRDARFLDVKLFALTALAGMSGGDVTADLLALITDDKTPPKVYEKAVQVLVARKDVTGLPVMVDALNVRYDYITGTRPLAVGVIARAIAAMGDLGSNNAVDAATRGAVVDALVYHLFAPQTPVAELVDVVKALGATGLPGTMQPLRWFLLTYRADPAFSTQTAAVGATIDALLTRGGVAERELVAFVAEDPNTQAGIAEYAARALRKADRQRESKKAAK